MLEEEESKRTEKVNEKGIVVCCECHAKYYAIFSHSCREVIRRFEKRTKKNGRRVERKTNGTLFEE